jgi:hypothetical protein
MVAYITSEEEVLNYLEVHPEGANPKQISFDLKKNKSTVRGICRKLFSEGRIRLHKNIRGYYELVENKDHGMFDFKFQNCFLKVKVPGLCKDIPQIEEDNKIIKTITSFYKGTENVTMHISTDYCIDLPAVLVLVNDFIHLVKLYTNIEVRFDDVCISNIEFNKDFANLKLEGANCVTLTSLIAQYKIYQKPGRVREELKMTVPITAPILNELLTKTNTHVDIISKIEANSKQINELSKNLKLYSINLGKLVDRIPQRKKRKQYSAEFSTADEY